MNDMETIALLETEVADETDDLSSDLASERLHRLATRLARDSHVVSCKDLRLKCANEAIIALGIADIVRELEGRLHERRLVWWRRWFA